MKPEFLSMRELCFLMGHLPPFGCPCPDHDVPSPAKCGGGDSEHWQNSEGIQGKEGPLELENLDSLAVPIGLRGDLTHPFGDCQ